MLPPSLKVVHLKSLVHNEEPISTPALLSLEAISLEDGDGVCNVNNFPTVKYLTFSNDRYNWSVSHDKIEYIKVRKSTSDSNKEKYPFSTVDCPSLKELYISQTVFPAFSQRTRNIRHLEIKNTSHYKCRAIKKLTKLETLIIEGVDCGSEMFISSTSLKTLELRSINTTTVALKMPQLCFLSLHYSQKVTSITWSSTPMHNLNTMLLFGNALDDSL
eukprot:CAMPEP_0168509000 /NCGR_PEP_ID=MMETSP0405-20121227/479_1 /TAXON_ID=498012 /ORGANISM="Trichosphaerium sp, Strain Am-I-7 wt" /LENGTH=216 /DNA_ID=CAMNT_0008526303 /DNA_START=412 /DNA_END=1059 /DNA_ORIENTATION=-